jgi:hypothetical protein
VEARCTSTTSTMANVGGVAQLSLGDVCNMMGLHRARALAGPVAALMVGLARVAGGDRF